MRINSNSFEAAIFHDIVTVYEIEQEGTYHFCSMELVDGESLQGRLDRKRKLPVPQALSILCDVVQALDHAWNHGRMVHRHYPLPEIRNKMKNPAE